MIFRRTLHSVPKWFNVMANENPLKLSRLPVPALSDTMEKYLKSIHPLVTPEEFTAHEKLVASFVSTVGLELQNELIKRDEMDHISKKYPFSYIERDWDEMYLAARYPSPIHVNPGYGLLDEADGNLQGGRSRVAYFLRSIARFSTKMKQGLLEPDKGPPQCMSGFSKQFGTSRIPQEKRDILEFYPESSHIAVLCNEQFFKLQLMSPDRQGVLSPTAIEAKLIQIQEQAKWMAPVSAFTGEERATWANVRNNMMESNKAVFDMVDSSLLVLVLDDRIGNTTAERSNLTLHGKAENRWFDKLQVLSYPDGHIGLNFEHSFSDGTTWNRWLHEVWHDMRESTTSGFSPLPRMNEFKDTTGPELYNWQLSTTLHDQALESQERLLRFTQTIDTEYSEIEAIAKKDIKKWKLSPDGVVQMAFQLAYHTLYGKAPPTYESCSTRSFLHGRTETIRSCTMEASNFVKSVFAGDSKEKQRSLFELAVNTHVALAKSAQQGLGVDRHLFALSSIAQQKGQKVPLFHDPIRLLSSSFRLSSSNVTMPILNYFCFGPVIPDGYGVGYLIQNDHVGVNLTSFKSSRVTESVKLMSEFNEATRTIRSFYENEDK